MSCCRTTYLAVAAVPSPNVSDGAADVAVCAPYGGALMPNVNPPLEMADVCGCAADAGASDGGAALPKPNGATDCCAGAACCGFETPNAKPVLADVACGAPNEKDIFQTIFPLIVQ